MHSKSSDISYTTASEPSLAVALERWATARPHAPFIVEAETGRTITYRAFARAVDALRQTWEAEGARAVMLALPGGIAAGIVWLAALTGGMRLIPCSPESSDDERQRLAASQRPDAIVVTRAAEAIGFARAGALVYTADDIYTPAISPFAPVTPAMMSPALDGSLRLTTSGTTGDPKGVVLSARQIAWTADQVRLSHHLTTADRGLAVLPFFHINAPVVSLCASLLAGACVVVAPRFSVQRFWEWVERERITWVSVVPTIVALLLTTEKPPFLPGTLRFARSASAPLPVARHRAFEERFGIPLIETYGLSEAASQVTANPLPPAQRKHGSVGVPTGVELYVCEPLPGTCELPCGAVGEICVRGPNVIAGYEGDASASSFGAGWFRTGDLGYLDADSYLYITGRLREVINRGGEKIAPREIEELLLAHPAVSDAAVVGEPHPLYGQRVVAYITPRDGWDALVERQLRDYCAQRLSAYKVPEAFYSVPALPRNGNGKLNRQALRRLAGQPDSRPVTARHGVIAHG
jgi:acyl-CoA synthetase (AMP-forming)/AMP-acid ligase II